MKYAPNASTKTLELIFNARKLFFCTYEIQFKFRKSKLNMSLPPRK